MYRILSILLIIAAFAPIRLTTNVGFEYGQAIIKGEVHKPFRLKIAANIGIAITLLFIALLLGTGRQTLLSSPIVVGYLGIALIYGFVVLSVSLLAMARGALLEVRNKEGEGSRK